MRAIGVVLVILLLGNGCATRHAAVQSTKPAATAKAKSKPKPQAAAKVTKGRPTPTEPTTGLTVTNGNQVITLANFITGKVVSVNAASRFMVLDYSLSQMPAIGDRLSIYRQGMKVGVATVSGPVNNNNLVADLTQGEAQAGDEARKE
jgi:hypothetical protein